MDALPGLQVLHSRCDIFGHFHQSLWLQFGSFVTQEGEKISTLGESASTKSTIWCSVSNEEALTLCTKGQSNIYLE